MEILKRRQQGQVLVITAAIIVVLLGVAALAMDLGRAYGVRARLNAAVDAACYEAAKVLGQGTDESSMRAKAATAAGQYFTANFPRGYLGATPSEPSVTALRDAKGVWRVTVSATAQVPAFFAGVVGKPGLEIGATAQSERSTLDLVLALDVSDSLSPVMNIVKDDAVKFVKMFSEADDRIGLVAFSTGAYPVVSLCGTYPNGVQNPTPESVSCSQGFDKRRVETAINDLDSSSATASEEGLKKALAQLNSLPGAMRSGHRVIVFFSDGLPNTFNGRFPLIAGGTYQGNLYAERNLLYAPNWFYDETTYKDPLDPRDPNHSHSIASLPTYDSDGTIPLKSYNDKRPLSGSDYRNKSAFRCDANRAARNMLENVANMARSQGITIYSLGLEADSVALSKGHDGPIDCNTYHEPGSMILNRVANTRDSDTYNPAQPEGVYCYARTIEDVKPCFDKIAKSILRITR